MAGVYSYRDYSHPQYKDAIRNKNFSTIKLVQTVSEFAHKLAEAHDGFSTNLQSIITAFQNKLTDSPADRSTSDSTLNSTWEKMLEDTQHQAQSHADTAQSLKQKLQKPLHDIATCKTNHCKKLHAFRENCESVVSSTAESVKECEKSYREAYDACKANMNSRNLLMYTTDFHQAHNDYIFAIRASNSQQVEYHDRALPHLLDELDSLDKDLALTMTSAIEEHMLLLIRRATEQRTQHDEVLKTCKEVDPKSDICRYLANNCGEKPVKYQPYITELVLPMSQATSEIMASSIKDTLIRERHTEPRLNARKAALQKEAAELTSFLKQSQDVTQSLMNACQRNLAIHDYLKVYQTHEDLSRKRNEIQLAHIQLSAIRSQIELLSPKQNGSTVDQLGGDTDKQGAAASNTSSIKGMWKKAFKSLKSRDRDKEKEKREEDKVEKSEDRKYSRMSSKSSKKGSMKRKDSKEAPPTEEEELGQVDDIDPVFKNLQFAGALARPARSSSLQGADSYQSDLNLEHPVQVRPKDNYQF